MKVTTFHATHAYYARWSSCDCIVAVCVDIPGDEKATAKDVASYIRRGYRVERLRVLSMEHEPWRCSEHPTGTEPPWQR